ncbi:MAG: class I SAM-dependent methyltransferase [Ruminococcaceae bacterium]|nr:class I SAM-dependent methyltransferase [Oscillospiraceae bacterium]
MGKIATGLIRATNRVFPKVVHPFNLQNDSEKTYAMWQYEKGEDTIRLFLEKYSLADLFEGKRVLDMGCGAAGKSLYYVSRGAKHVTGVEIVEHYQAEAEALAESLGFSDRFTFVSASALSLPFPDGSFDTIIMNDFMEHVSDPEGVLQESLRLLAPGGRIFINFPPYYHPYGAHLSDVINMPWVHMFFTERMLVEAYRDLVRGLPDEKERLELRLSKNERGEEYFGYINHMTLKRFKKILAKLEILPEYYAEVPLRKVTRVLAKLPLTDEMFVKMAVCVIKK